MPGERKVKDFMIRLVDYPHIPQWFTLGQALAIVRETALRFEGAFEPRAVLVFDEKYQLSGILTLGDIVKGLEPRFLQETALVKKKDPSVTALLEDVFGPEMKEQANRQVSEAMSPIKVTVNADNSLVEALALMMSENVGLMPVMQENKVVGMIRLSDIVRVIARFVLED